jgi:hypothetical protein
MSRAVRSVARSYTAATSTLSGRPAPAAVQASPARQNGHRGVGASSRSFPPVAVPYVSSAPTAAFVQHHDVDAPQVDGTAFRQAWRVRTRLNGLLEDALIDREQWDAMQQWIRLAGRVAPIPASGWTPRVDHSIVPDDSTMLYRVRVAAQQRSAIEALGALRIHLLDVVARDFSWQAIARMLGVVDGKTARSACIEAITALSDWLAGRPVNPEAPLARPRRPRIEPGKW